MPEIFYAREIFGGGGFLFYLNTFARGVYCLFALIKNGSRTQQAHRDRYNQGMRTHLEPAHRYLQLTPNRSGATGKAV